ncbi:MAG: 16S rRNA (cytosine(967)-C(5))-methyltransferase RsmB [Verrucomicrobiaceae bacterium]|nr:16S rRNA (cytosine(967)-C(5))-methyltransferase RsmB [Verrucomicrobiaceae bacterium]
MTPRSARELALAALGEWRSRERFTDTILARLLAASDLSGPDRAFATELFYGVLRNLTLVDYWIDQLRSGRLDQSARDLLRLGIYQLFFLETPAHAAVFETVELAAPGIRSLINGVLRNAVRKKDSLREEATRQSLSVRSSHPEFLIERWTRNFGADETAALCGWNNRPAPIYARINRLKISDAEFLETAGSARCTDGTPNFVRLTSIATDVLAQGYCYIQDPSTALACELLAPKPCENVLDACAAPGGKTAYLAELMENRGSIVACDRDAQRIRTLEENLQRLGVEISRLIPHDWTAPKLPADLPAAPSFDRILVDAPCSNTGVMRRRVDLRWRLTPKDFSRMAGEQLRILRAVIPLLKTGGMLVYSTCSIEPEENEETVRSIIGEFPFLNLTKEVSLLPFRDGFDGAYAAKLTRVR